MRPPRRGQRHFGAGPAGHKAQEKTGTLVHCQEPNLAGGVTLLLQPRERGFAAWDEPHRSQGAGELDPRCSHLHGALLALLPDVAHGDEAEHQVRQVQLAVPSEVLSAQLRHLQGHAQEPGAPQATPASPTSSQRPSLCLSCLHCPPATLCPPPLQDLLLICCCWFMSMASKPRDFTQKVKCCQRLSLPRTGLSDQGSRAFQSQER